MERLSVLLLSLLCCAWIHTSSVAGINTPFAYNNQAAWPGVCNVGNTGRQSPIDIVTANVQEKTSLSALTFSSSWGQASTNGGFVNNGHTVVFNLSASSPSITTEMPVGNYRVFQFHFHWGSGSGTGSEHRINGQQSELEVHFVHKSIGSEDAGSEFAVIGVLADMSNDPISGVWETLQVSSLTDPTNSTTITNLNLSSLLPADRDYYHYPGSLTTPLCNESVQWFVLKNRITVPAAYLTALRMINSLSGTPLTFNFRMLQPLNGRTVTTPGSSAVIKSPSSIAVVLLLAVLVIAGFN